MTPHRYCSCGRIFDSVEARAAHYGPTRLCLDPNTVPALQLGPGYTWRLRTQQPPASHDTRDGALGACPCPVDHGDPEDDE